MPYHHGDLSTALLKRARETLSSRGYAGVSLRELAQAEGVSAAAPYRHFKDRDALVAAVLTEAFNDLTERTRNALSADRDPRQALVQVGVAYVHFALEQPHIYRLMFGGVVDKDQHPALRQAGDGAMQVLLEAVKHWRLNNGMDNDPGDDEPVALIAWALSHGLSSLLIDGLLPDRRANATEMVSALFERVVNGLSR